MLIILVGGTLEVGKNSRTYFEKNGYPKIQKYNHYYGDSNYYHFDEFINRTEEEVEKCDFKYSMPGGKTGFYKTQIIDAVRGRCNALLTMSPDNLEFVREIKDMYKEYVMIVYLYIDKKSLEKITRTYVKDELQVQMRLKKGAKLRKAYLDNAELFDKTVIFSSDEEFNMEALYFQYDIILKEAEKIQKNANSRLYVELPYTGNQNYVFVSYAHSDSRIVMPYLSALQRAGYRIWYDEGIHKGSNWTIMLGERLQNCTSFLLFSSENSINSKHVENEINGAMKCENVTPITVRLDDKEFPFGYEMFLSKYQVIYGNNENAVSEIQSALNPLTKVNSYEN